MLRGEVLAWQAGVRAGLPLQSRGGAQRQSSRGSGWEGT